jgi:hypothetical protein
MVVVGVWEKHKCAQGGITWVQGSVCGVCVVLLPLTFLACVNSFSNTVAAPSPWSMRIAGE